MRELTREEILAMEPGQILDYYVAEKVMGGVPWGPFQPSTEISDAWKVLEKFPLVQIEYVEIFEGNKSATVRVWSLGSDIGNDGIAVSARTAAEAICKGALLAVLEATP